MAGENATRNAVIMGLVGAGEGILLGRGLEMCFGVGQYLLIMLFGVLGGTGIALMVWLGGRMRGETGGGGRRPAWVGAGVATGVFVLWFLLRVLPLVREEIRFSR